MDPGKKSDKLTFCIKLETLPSALMRWRVVRSQMGEQIEGTENVMDGKGLDTESGISGNCRRMLLIKRLPSGILER